MTPQPITLDDILADLARFPETLHLPLLHNSLGSPYVVIETDADTVTALGKEAAVNAFRRVLLDPVRGLVMLMSPSRRHERLTRATDRFVPRSATRLGVDCEILGSNRWSGKGVSVEADDGYYVGDKAVRYLASLKDSEAAADKFTADNAPDLVVEVTYSHYDAVKMGHYRSLGVPEYWQLKAYKGKQDKLQGSDVDFIDLQATPAPLHIPVSGKLHGITPAALADCMNRMNTARVSEWDEVIDQVLLDHGVILIDTDDNDGGGAPAGFVPG